MERGFIPSTQRKNGAPKEVFRELGARERHKERIPGGKESPESGSLYSDYESGQQYEQDLPSGYNSGEQYDTISTGYMSGEAYELPETRLDLQEPVLASIEEVSTRSTEDLFTIQMPENQLLVQAERLGSSTSSSIQDPLEVAGLPETGGHKAKRKKTVSYCVSVPMEKSPLGHEIRAYRDIPSDTDTTSCFDSDGTYMRSEGLSSDSGAALIHHSTKKRRRELVAGGETGIIRGSKKRMRKAKRIIRNHEEFFLIYDNKYWALARQVCFWFSILAILGSITAAGIMIAFMPHACDPEMAWWQGSVIVEVGPTNNRLDELRLDLQSLIAEVPSLQNMGIQGVKLISLYLKNPDDSDVDQIKDVNLFNAANDFESLKLRLGNLADISKLAKVLHDVNMTLIVDIPAHSANQTIEPELDFRITKAIQFWAGHGVDGITLLGLNNYGEDPFVSEKISAWSTDFEKYSSSTNRILITSYLFPESIDQNLGNQISPVTRSVSGAGAIANFRLLNAELNLKSGNMSEIGTEILDVLKWDKSLTQPWILWKGSRDPTPAQLSFHLLLPGTISLPWSAVQSAILNESAETNHSSSILADLVFARKHAVPLYMNGNYKVCSGIEYCSEQPRENNFKINVFDDLVVMERHYNRRNRYMVMANLGANSTDLIQVSKLFSDGEVVVDTTGVHSAGSVVKFKTISALPPDHALVVKLPK